MVVEWTAQITNTNKGLSITANMSMTMILTQMKRKLRARLLENGRSLRTGHTCGKWLSIASVNIKQGDEKSFPKDRSGRKTNITEKDLQGQVAE